LLVRGGVFDYKTSIPFITDTSKRPQASTNLWRKRTTKGFKTMAKAGPLEFFRQVKSEAQKVTWPTRQETTVSTIAVFVMVFVASLFLFFADQVLAFAVGLVLGLGS
jgi:preprotein translocase subunit SecE